jgi:putative hemolysin
MMVLILVLGLLTALSALFSGSETALFSLSPITLRSYQRDASPRRRLVAQLMAHPRQLLVTLMMGNVTVNTLIQNGCSALAGPEGGWALKIGVPLGLTLILGEIIPKAVALPYHRTVAIWVAPTIGWLYRIMTPVRRLLVLVTNPVSRVMFFFLSKEPPLSAAEIEHAIQASAQTGVLSQEELLFLKGMLRLRQASVRELMRPRDEILYYDVAEPLERLTHLFKDLECSHLPVCKGGLDAILGVLSLETYLLERHQIQQPEQLIPLLRPPLYLPELTPARMALSQLRQQGETLGLVVDEYGTLSGLIAQEDLMETVVGEISDRRDEKAPYSWIDSATLVASGKMELIQLEQLMGTVLPNPHRLVTVGGWLTDYLGTIPAAGSRHRIGTLLFQVLAADPQRVRRLFIRRAASSRRGSQ